MQSKKNLHLLLLLASIAIGTALRFTQLTLKSPWTDEFATLVFSLGNSFHTVPLDQAISLETLLKPLQLDPDDGGGAVTRHLFAEDHHPPLYFLLAHWWMKLFPTSAVETFQGTSLLWAARSLPALLGVVSIPAMYGLGWLAFRSRLVAQLAAAMMAVSPYGIYLAQEARHYTLGILWVIASLCCLVVAVQHLQRRTPLPIRVVLCWIVVNSLGIATHYFFILTLCAEAIVLLGFCLLQSSWIERLGKFLPIPHFPFPIPPSHWWRIALVATGTLVGCLVWLPVLQSSYDPQMTQWIRGSDRTFLTTISPIFQALAAWITMISLLPVEASSLLVVLASGAVMIGFFIWAVPIFYRGIKIQGENPETRLVIGILVGFVLGAIALFFGITYIFDTDLTRGARYNFVYFPSIILLVAAALAVSWNDLGQDKSSHKYTISQKRRAVAIIWLMGLFSGITVVSNLGYQKYYRPDLLVPMIQQTSPVSVLIATTHNTLVQTGELMGIAWEFKGSANLQALPLNPQFLLAHQDQYRCEGTACQASTTLDQTLAQLSRPLDVWLVNFNAPVKDMPNCFAEDSSQYQILVDGYDYRMYHCLTDDFLGKGKKIKKATED
ncbi:MULTISPECIES: glycosyltransferase family 39 protein [unclassified Coleofasciculus]|uniref:glycosyltransferase family 39 protein n=1 Tax=unclassified Coleofasciculus TaxID=2692782 RepID=UPI00187F74DE|nr:MULTISPECIES: glycosyltransferase [unclassified Coleofasciculus]MBE9129184.1 glycosyltransferase [Coleofasciculus sp. LEGE 07081]MBE9151835.1 glycosyltransferase [Coleofasciculus sp. LEGE 07092]